MLRFFGLDTSDHLRLLQFYLGSKPTCAEIERLSLFKLTAKIFYGLIFLQQTPVEAFHRKTVPIKPSKDYLNFGHHGQAALTPKDFLNYGVSLLSEVMEEASSLLCVAHSF